MAELWQRKFVRRLGIPVATLLVSVALSGCLGWFPQLSTDDLSQIIGISCPSTSVCFAVGQTVSGQTTLQTSTDGGGMWSSLTGAIGGASLNAISCPDVGHCLAVGGNDDGDAIETTDGGSSWAPVAIPSSGYGFSSVWCLDDQHCWVAEGISSSSDNPVGNQVLRTTDGGATWSSSSVIAPTVPDSSGVGLTSITCPTVTVCTAVGDEIQEMGSPLPVPVISGVIATSSDGGRTWSAQTSPDDFMYAVGCLTSANCVTGSAGGLLHLQTTDGGGTWSVTPISVPGLNAWPDAISCPDSLHCTAAGLLENGGSPTPDTPLISTSDGGNTWSLESTDAGHLELEAVSCPTVSVCWAAGGKVPGGGNVSTGSIVLHTLTGGVAWPSVSAISPSGGTEGGGIEVTITGAGFQYGTPSVQFGSMSATDVTVVSGTEITAIVPPSAFPGESSTADVTVTNALGTSPVNPDDQYTYQDPPLTALAHTVAAEAVP